MGSSSPPAAPDPSATASAQTGENVSTAIANAELGHVNQTNAYGDTSTYSQNGSNSFTDPTSGKVYQIPTYSQTTQLSAPQQQLYNTTEAAQQGAASTAEGLIGQAQTQLLSLSIYRPTISTNLRIRSGNSRSTIIGISSRTNRRSN